MKKNILFYLILCLLLTTQWSCKQQNDTSSPRPTTQGHKEKKDNNPDKDAPWTPEQAARHQKILTKLEKQSKTFNKDKSKASYADGRLFGSWKTRAAKNMPGAFQFAEMVDGTDIMYAVTHNHYVTGFNSKSYIYKGTVYNSTTKKGGDDFKIITANWPNRYTNLIAFKIGDKIRLIANVENGPIYYSDDDGNSWNKATGLPGVIKSSAINKQDNNKIYVTDNKSIFISTDFGETFSKFQDFGSNASTFVYSPRYNQQADANKVYLARSGDFYTINDTATSFTKTGTYTASHGSKTLSVAGDSRRFYITEGYKYWVSSNKGADWEQKFPKGNYYGDRDRSMAPGKFFAVHPENPEISLGGYVHPIVSTTALSTTLSTNNGWAGYQNGTHLPPEGYYNRIRFSYHPDFQSSHFFYNSSGTLLSVRCSDGGVFISYKEWTDYPTASPWFDKSSYETSHYINVTLLDVPSALIYRKSLFTGANNPDHIYFSTQDQGAQNVMPNTIGGDLINVYQTLGGDGPSVDSHDGKHAWKWGRRGDKVWASVKVYGNNGAYKSFGQVNGQFGARPTVSFNSGSYMGWTQTYIDQDQPDKRIWMLNKNLDRATINGDKIEGHTVNKGTNQVAALAQGKLNPDLLWLLQDGKVFKSTNRGDTFGDAINTPFAKSTLKTDHGSGVILPNNNDWILFAGPSNNAVGSILSKDGGKTWIDVTGDFPADNDAQTSGMIATPDSKFVFAGTDIGPYVFDVEKEKWFSIGEGIGFFNSVDLDYIESINTMRFGTWGSGVIDFKIEDTNTEEEEVIEEEEPDEEETIEEEEIEVVDEITEEEIVDNETEEDVVENTDNEVEVEETEDDEVSTDSNDEDASDTENDDDITGEDITLDDIENIDLEEDFATHISFYPNPVRDELTVVYDTRETAIVTIVFYNIAGKEVGGLLNENPSINKELMINLSHLQTGTYFMKIESNKNTVVKSFIIR